MRRWPTLIALALPALAAAQELPQRKPGLWEMAMQMPGLPAGAMSSQHCVDAKTDAELQRRAMAGDPRTQCQPPKTRRNGGVWEMQLECTSPEGRMSAASKMSGDFNQRYSVETTMRFDPPRGGQAGMQMKIDAQHKGPCPAGMAPGEMRMGPMNFKPPTGRP